MIEYEKTYLVRYLPAGLEGCPREEIEDVYLPVDAAHPVLRIRKIGDHKEITKKVPLDKSDRSEQSEDTISLSDEEYAALAVISGKRLIKTRFAYQFGGRTAEIDIFYGGLEGLALADFEFATALEKASFTAPDFCLADVTEEEFVAGGLLAGKNYNDIRDELERFGFCPVFIVKQK